MLEGVIISELKGGIVLGTTLNPANLKGIILQDDGVSRETLWAKEVLTYLTRVGKHKNGSFTVIIDGKQRLIAYLPIEELLYIAVASKSDERLSEYDLAYIVNTLAGVCKNICKTSSYPGHVHEIKKYYGKILMTIQDMLADGGWMY